MRSLCVFVLAATSCGPTGPTESEQFCEAFASTTCARRLRCEGGNDETTATCRQTHRRRCLREVDTEGRGLRRFDAQLASTCLRTLEDTRCLFAEDYAQRACDDAFVAQGGDGASCRGAEDACAPGLMCVANFRGPLTGFGAPARICSRCREASPGAPCDPATLVPEASWCDFSTLTLTRAFELGESCDGGTATCRRGACQSRRCVLRELGQECGLGSECRSEHCVGSRCVAQRLGRFSEACTQTSDCEAPLTCLAGFCRSTLDCTTTALCGQGEICEGRRCVVPPPGSLDVGASCSSSGQCKEGQRCNVVCVRIARLFESCAGELQNGIDVTPLCSEHGHCSNGTCQPAAEPVERGALAIGAPCSNPSQCASGQCLPARDDVPDERFCSDGC